MKDEWLRKIPILSSFYYREEGCETDRDRGLNEERVEERHRFHYQQMFVWLGLAAVYLTIGFRYEEWNVINQGVMIQKDLARLVDYTFQKLK